MRAFFARERAWIDQLIVACAGMTVPMDRYLEQVFFNDTTGRALILQPVGRFGYFYMRTVAFDDEQQRRAELKALVDLMMMLTALRDKGWLVVMDAPHELSTGMHFVGALFDHPRPSTAHVILNPQGDFSFDPETIQNADNDVIYKGMRIEGDLYRLVSRHLGGTAYASEQLVGLAASWRLSSMPTLRSMQAPTPTAPPAPSPPPAPARAHTSTTARLFVAGALALAGVMLALGLQPGKAEKPDAAAASPAVGSAAAVTEIPTAAPVVLANTTATTVYGVDLSKWNAAYLDAALATEQVKFVILRASYGQREDSDFRAAWARLGRHAVARGAYHFYRAGEAPTDQLSTFLSLYPTNDPQAMPPILDFEELSFDAVSQLRPISLIQDDLLSALMHLEQATGQTPVLYTNYVAGNRYLDDARFARFPLWIADWTSAKEPRLPNAWKDVGYRFWQRSSNYTLVGETKAPVDMDVFRGPPSGLFRQEKSPTP